MNLERTNKLFKEAKMKMLSRKGQSTLEYAILIACIVGALIVMQIYLKRAFQGKMAESTDQIGEQFDVNHSETHSYSTRTGQVTQIRDHGVQTNETTVTETREGSEHVGLLSDVD
jgi:uncharacterized protein (UPF0333 family)